MKQGTPLQEISTRILADKPRKEDFLISTSSLRMLPEGNLQLDCFNNREPYTPTDICHRHLADKLKIPIAYYRRMMGTNPHLLSSNVNHWLHSQPDTKCFRTFKPVTASAGVARAFLGRHYNPMDNFDLLENIMPKLAAKGCNMKSCEITESRLYIHATFPEITGEIKAGDVVQAGIQIRNSEVGMGSLQVNPWVYRLVCANGMKVADAGVRRYHAGRDLVKDHSMDAKMYKDETRKATDKAFWLQVSDIVDSVLDRTQFAHVVETYRRASERYVNPSKSVEEITKRYDLTEDEGGSILQRLAEGADLTQWGLANAITSEAHEAESYERAVDLERIGGEVVVLESGEWMRN